MRVFTETATQCALERFIMVPHSPSDRCSVSTTRVVGCTSGAPDDIYTNSQTGLKTLEQHLNTKLKEKLFICTENVRRLQLIFDCVWWNCLLSYFGLLSNVDWAGIWLEMQRNSMKTSGSEDLFSVSIFQLETFRIWSRNDNHSTQILCIILLTLFPLVHLQITLQTQWSQTEGVDVRILLLILHSALDGDKWSAAGSYCFTPGDRAGGTNWIGSWMDSRNALDSLKRKSSCLAGIRTLHLSTRYLVTILATIS